MNNCDVVGKIHSLESLATLDGDGVRYGVFLVGCPLRCVYCHNPDTWANSG
ncbi:MAG: 4Fe-4S cluster-binding domain-containing protein, partial [Christensenellales bacterium]